MGNIILLDELTINKIAAGEVIERPASVVKEMVENSIDAGATSINIEIKNGGISYIRITDNGKGISRDDLDMAFERHATSKIKSAEELSTVNSMGFRGEALASIAAISKVELISRTKDSDSGNKIIVEGGKILGEIECGSEIGTTITVENLFFNTPVRYKFLKRDFSEAGAIEDYVTRLALINVNIAFKLINGDKTVIQTSGNGDMKSVIYNIYGKDVANGTINLDYEYEDMKLTGVIGKPELARSNRNNQIFFVNGRYIKDKALSAAVEQAYKGLLIIGKFGFAIVNIQLKPEKVDVNVHPAKLEVRFAEENLVFKAMYHAVRESLLKGDPTSLGTQFTKNNDTVVPNIQQPIIKEEIPKEKELEEAVAATIAEEPSDVEPVTQKTVEIETIQEDYHFSIPDIIKGIVEENTPANVVEEKEKVVEPEFENMYEKLFGKSKTKEIVKEKHKIFETVEIAEKSDNLTVFEDSTKYGKAKYKFIGIVFSTYIIIEIENEMYIIDQHAAHERIMYEKIKENFYKEENKDSQVMLLPDVVELTNKEITVVQENMAVFEKAGFAVEDFGNNTVKLSAVPMICMDLDTKELFLEVLDAINTVAITAYQEKEERFIATVACKAAVKANMALTKEEVDALLEKLLVLNNPFTCPHGRPTAIKMSKKDIEKKFARIQ